MTQKAKLPDRAAIDRAIARMRETCRQLDALTLLLDDAIAQVEAENRPSPLYVHRLERARHLLNSRSSENSEEKDGE